MNIPQHVGQHEAAFGIGVQNGDGLAGHGFDNIAWSLRLAINGVFNHANGAHDIHFGFAFCQGVHEPDDASSAAHITFHVFHAGCGLDRNATRIEGHAFANEGKRRFALLAAVPAHDNQTGFKG